MQSRRQFLSKSALGAWAASGTVGGVQASAAQFNEEILVYIFLRGGIDGLNVVVPLNDEDHEYYSIMRPTLSIPDTGTGRALPIAGQPFGFNPLADPLKDLYDSGYLAIIQATGTPDAAASRSHFDAEKYVELGTPGFLGTTTGWLQRHFLAMTGPLAQYPDEMLLPIVAYRTNPPTSLLGSTSTLTVNDPANFRLDNAHWYWAVDEKVPSTQLGMLTQIYDLDSDVVSLAGREALSAESTLRARFDTNYTGAGSSPYQDNTIAQQLRSTAQLIKLGLDSRIFSLDFGNFDSHAAQDDPERFDILLDDLSRALAAFFDDLENSSGPYADRTTVIIQSEFGRRAFENITRGTDHGNGNIMLVAGKQVNGGRIFGTWPGLYPGTADGWVNYPNPRTGSTEPELFEGALATTTDFRQVLSDYLALRCQHTAKTLGDIFPGYTGYRPMGLFKNAVDHIFSGDFESQT